MSVTVVLRPVTAADRALLLEIYASSRAPELAVVLWTAEEKAAFLRQQFDCQDQHYRTAYEGAEFSVIVLNGTDAGRLIVHRGPEILQLMDITLLEAWRGQGTGTGLIRQLMEEAAASGKTMRLWVEEDNPAWRLYARLGFVRTGEEFGPHRELAWTPNQANTAS